jgi:hypothetical protein
MTDITINIKTGSESSEPKVTTTSDNMKTAVAKTESPKVETPKTETKEETISENETPKKDDSKKNDMTEAEQAKMGSKKD